MSRKYTTEEMEWVKSHSQFATTIKAMCDEFNKEFNRNVSSSDYSRLYNRVTGTTPKTVKLFPDEVISFIKDNCYQVLNSETTKMVNDKFETNYSVDQISRARKRYNIPNGIDCTFHKGNEPYNKGKKIMAHPNSVKTQFKKGGVSINHLPVGTITIRDGKSQGKVKYIKVAEPNKWALLNRYVWEQETGENLTNADIIAFKDGNPMNCEFDNLCKISQKQNAVINKNKLRVNDSQYFETTLMVANLMLSKKKRG